MYLGNTMDAKIVRFTDDVYNLTGSRHKLLVEFLSQSKEFDKSFFYGICEFLLYNRKFPLVNLTGWFVD